MKSVELERHAEAQESPPRPRLVRSREDRMIAGVAGGFAHYFSIDPVIVRLIFVVLALTGGGVLAYIIAWIVIPEAGEGEEPASDVTRGTSMLVGLALVGVGGLLLVNQLIPGFSWRFVAPLALIGVGVLLLARREGAR